MFDQFMHSLGIEPMTLVLQAPLQKMMFLLKCFVLFSSTNIYTSLNQDAFT